jgi:aldehyde dehydrogenase
MSASGNSIDHALIADVVQEVLSKLQGGTGGGMTSSAPAGALGVFDCVDAAVNAAAQAQQQLTSLLLPDRQRVIDAIRMVMRRDKEELGRIEFDETKIGRLQHKIDKLEVAAGVPGIEMLRTEATSGDHGLTVTEYAPYGVIGIVTPVTHSVPTLGCNAIMILSAGNALVCNPHPSGAGCAVEATRRWNREIVKLTGIDNLICIINNPTLENC